MELHPNFNKAEQLLERCFESGGKLLVCGNGGSSADSAHIAGELLKGFLRKRPVSEKLAAAFPGAERLQQGLPAIDLSAHAAALTAIANDQGGELIFAQQVTAYGRPGDVLIGISTSGNSRDVCLALRAARALGLSTIGMTGRAGGEMKELCDVLLNVDADETYRVQELHLPLYHALCAGVEAHFFAE